MGIRVKIIQALLDIHERIFFYPKLRAFYQKQKENHQPTILDVGANKGQSIDFFLSLFPNARIFAFEPNPVLFQKLQQKYRGNSLIHLVNKGVSNQNGQLELKETVTDETSTFEDLNYESKYLERKTKILGVNKDQLVRKSYWVDVIRLSDFIQEQGITDIHILKIDTEGHEYNCLEGLFSGDIPLINFIQLEHHNDDMYLQAKGQSPEKLLEEKGFASFDVIGHGFGNLDERIYTQGL
jgi:FkbM family methyltransferase